jgi:hypothetical protein
MVRADARPGTAFPQAQRDASDIVALFYKQAGGDGTIDAAAHGDHHFHRLGTHLRVLRRLERFERMELLERKI